MASPFQAEEYLQTDSSNGGESDFEHLSPTYVAEPQAMHNWLGKLYLAYRLGKITIEAARPSATQDELHIDMMRRMIDFPYAARLESVQHRDVEGRKMQELILAYLAALTGGRCVRQSVGSLLPIANSTTLVVSLPVNTSGVFDRTPRRNLLGVA
ncbi:hypothetical protein LTR56_027177 [Elasticomyces elasticus]|nr:hypothetical protein LTR56_027177 [Elasticomyces elasticus]KAK4897257.1 hypothetical protein LTR49_028013 [Elasticomyces elasticus]KAK5732990.1 hypothetical protein LTS12_027030 [Elasticomyces elasticus]